MSDCGVIEFMRGGTISEGTIVNSAVSGSVVTGSELTSSRISALADIDADSAGKIANAIASLPVEQLIALGKAIASALPAAPRGPAPKQASAPELPTNIMGGRTALLGEPTTWVQMPNGYVTPAYESGLPGSVVTGSVTEFVPGPAPDASDGTELPTTVAGERDMLLGRPVAWLQTKEGYSMPVYDKGTEDKG